MAAIFVAADQVTKHLFLQAQSDGQTIVPGLLGIIKHENHGIVANFPLPQTVTILISLIIIAAVIKGIRNTNHMLEIIGLAEILGGAIGNLIDRLMNGYVFDWILLFDRMAINLADLFIVEGALIFLYARWLQKRMKEKEINSQM